MAILTNIRESRGLMELSLDGVLWLRVRKKHFGMLPLEIGEGVDPDAYLDRLSALQAADCYEAALTALDHAAQTSRDLAQKLTRKGFAAPAAEAAVARLVENGLIDDQRYAQRMAQSQINKAVGAYAVRRKLMAKGLPQDAIEAAMEDFDGEQQGGACREAAEKLWRKYASLPAREGRAKLAQALARRGFGWDCIQSAVESIANEDPEALE